MMSKNSNAASAPIKHTKILIIVLVLVLATAVAAGIAWQQYFRPYSPGKFQLNKWNEPYSQNIPLHEMNLGEYGVYFPKNVTLPAYPDLVETIALPCDVRYYAKPGDTEPALTLPKGSNVHINVSDIRGSSLSCWPDYQKGWRYGTPLAAEGSTGDEVMYYVRTADLDEVAKAFVDANWSTLSHQFRFKAEAASFLVRRIDRILYQEGCFCSPDL